MTTPDTVGCPPDPPSPFDPLLAQAKAEWNGVVAEHDRQVYNAAIEAAAQWVLDNPLIITGENVSAGIRGLKR